MSPIHALKAIEETLESLQLVVNHLAQAAEKETGTSGLVEMTVKAKLSLGAVKKAIQELQANSGEFGTGGALDGAL